MISAPARLVSWAAHLSARQNLFNLAEALGWAMTISTGFIPSNVWNGPILILWWIGLAVAALFTRVRRRIAFASTRDGAAAIYVVDANGGEVKRVSGRNLAADVASWSPDGTQLVFHGVQQRKGGLLGLFD